MQILVGRTHHTSSYTKNHTTCKEEGFKIPFSENLRETRKKKNFSQEQLAELLNVSRQAISKWEQDEGYPAAETLIQLARLLEVSLDYLLLDQKFIPSKNDGMPKSNGRFSSDGMISIRSHDGNQLSAHHEFTIIRMFGATKRNSQRPQCLLGGKPNHWWDGVTTLGWYATIEDAQKELAQIEEAVQNGESTYQLQYCASVKGNFNPKIVDSTITE